MFPPQQSIQIDLAALSGICGSISIACWVVVFSPQIIKNFRRSSAEGISIVFLVIWLAGDVFNILGAILQGVLPTMVILAVYYTLADIVLILQVFYYRGFTLSDRPSNGHGNENGVADGDSERRPLLQSDTRTAPASPDVALHADDRRHSDSAHRRFSQLDGAHLSPATPLHDPPKAQDPASSRPPKPNSVVQQILFNAFAILLVCAAGFLGWWVSQRASASKHERHHRHHHHGKNPTPEPLEFDLWGQFFGYLCAIFYLGSRVPQLILNYRTKSTEGLSLLFFLFACIGNLTFDMSIFAYDPNPLCRHGGGPGLCGPGEATSIYLRYLEVNASWIAGSLGTLFLDLAIFAQFFMYRKDDDDDDDDLDDSEWDVQNGSRADQ